MEQKVMIKVITYFFSDLFAIIIYKNFL